MINSEKSALRLGQFQFKGDTNSILAVGLHFRQLGMYESALDNFIQAEKEAESIAAIPLLVEALMWQGECLKLLTRYIEAVAAFGRVLSLHTRGELTGEWAVKRIYVVKFTLLEIGLALIPDSPRDRLMYLESLLSAAEDTLWWLNILGKNHWRAAILLQMASILEELERWDEAVSTAKEALSVRLEYDEGPAYTLSGHLVTLANILRRIGKSNQALNVIERTLRERTLPVSDIIGAKIAQVYIFLSKQGFALTACDKAREAVRLADASESIVQRVKTRLTLAKALAASNQWKEVLETIDQAMAFQRGNTTYIGKEMRRHLRNSLANLSQSSNVDAHPLDGLKKHLAELGPEEEPWGEKLSYDDVTEEVLRWDKNRLIPEMFSVNTLDPESVAELILAWLSLDNSLQLTTLVFWIVESFGVSASDQDELTSRLKEALTTRDRDIRKSCLAEVLEWVTQTQSWYETKDGSET